MRCYMNIYELFMSDYTLRIVAFGSALLGLVSGVIGSFAVIKKQGLLGDAVSHASLPGIAIAFLLIQHKNIGVFMLGALVFGLIATAVIVAIDKYTRIQMDSSMALVLSTFFGFGLVLLTYIQKIPNANQAGLDKFIFGQASTLLKADIYVIVAVGILLLVLVVMFWKELKITCFDPIFADSIGVSSKTVSYILSTMIVLSIIIGLQTVGVILMSAMLVAPGVAARQWTNKLSIMVVLGGIFGAISGLIGTLISSVVPKMPTGPSIVMIISVIVVISITLAPNRGLLWRYLRNRTNAGNINDDQVLMNLYDLAINHQNVYHSHHIRAIRPTTTANKKGLHALAITLESLRMKKYVKKEPFDEWAITDKGIEYVLNHPMRKEEAYVSSN